MTLRGLTWDHPRAYRPLLAFAESCPNIQVSWDRQALADFEARPIATLAQRYDLMIIDHPGLGAAIAAHALQPLDQLVPAYLLAAWQAGSAGPTWGSYTVASNTGAHQQWAVPIDAATQVSVLRPDLAGAAPRDWAGVPAMARRHRTALCLGGPHAFLTLLAMCASARPGPPGDPLLDPGGAAAAIEILRAVWREADQEVSAGNPIAVHEAMSAGTGLAYCPLAYGYASYARPEPGRHALAWADVPGFGSPRPGTVLGGTGLAVSAPRHPDPAEVLRFLTAFLAPEVQAGLVPAQAGQPALAAAWDSPAVDQAWGRYYSSTRRSLGAAWVRPRADGWIPLQDQASALVRAAITGEVSAPAAINEINARYRALTRPEPAEAGAT
jgi:multiple sugar transport system substrate-binding protein